MRKRGYEIILFITYIAMVAVCVYLNFFTITQAGDITNIVVNIAMFAIVALILILSVAKSLLPASSMTADLIYATDKIENDAKTSHRFLWEKYREDKEELFTSKVLRKQYRDYLFELGRIVRDDSAYYKCDIEDYIGLDLVDSVIHRERMNQVAGVMTGLGILGTFIGLSLGLQSFNTGTTAQITSSIEPLMEGIKVAFHTSIYGMVFSLVFNYVYKRRLDDAENAVRDFLGAYRKYVMPDTASDGFNHLMELQRRQTDAVMSLSGTMADRLSENLEKILEPEFAHFDQTITSFANVATKNQMDQLARIVDAFVAEMNRSLEYTFSKLSEKIDNTIVMQEENERLMKEIYEKNLTTAENVRSIAEQTQSVAGVLRQYTDRVVSLEKQTGENRQEIEGVARSLERQTTETRQEIEGVARTLEKRNGETRQEIESVARSLEKQTGEARLEIESMARSLEKLNAAIQNAETRYKR